MCLWLFENFPNVMVLCGISAQIVHYVILSNFPYVYFLSPAFLLGAAFILINHYLAFQYFSAHYYMFSEVSTYMTNLKLLQNFHFSGDWVFYVMSLVGTFCTFCFIISK